jgi:hypothetical protein
VQSDYKYVVGSIEQHRVSCRELGGVLEMAVEGDNEEMTRNEVDCAKKTS